MKRMTEHAVTCYVLRETCKRQWNSERRVITSDDCASTINAVAISNNSLLNPKKFFSLCMYNLLVL